MLSEHLKIISLLLFILLFPFYNNCQNKIFWADGDIFCSNPDGTNVEDIVSGVYHPEGIDLDIKSGKIYWATKSGEIQKCNIDGSNIETIVSGGNNFRGIALDLINNRIYWIDDYNEKISRSNLDGSNIEDIITDLSAPFGIDLDMVNSKIYWTDRGTKKIQRSDLNGNQIEDVISNLVNPFYLEIDTDEGKIYCADGDNAVNIYRLNIDGSNKEAMTVGYPAPKGVALDVSNQKLYFTLGEYGPYGKEIRRINFDKTEDELLVSCSNPRDIAFYDISQLPVELIIFKAEEKENNIVLNWTTVTEVNNYGFEIERCKTTDVKSQTWERIGFITGSGNSNSPKEYSFTDRIACYDTILYRLKQIDNDGQIKYSESVSVLLKPNEFGISQNYPNPFNPATVIKYQIPKSTFVLLKLYDILGKEVKTLVNEEKQPGEYEVKIDGSGLSSGVYLYQIIAGDFIQTHKMILQK